MFREDLSAAERKSDDHETKVSGGNIHTYRSAHDHAQKGGEVEYGVSVRVRVSNVSFIVAVGEAGQSIKWLSLVAAQRYESLVQAHGKQRQREDALLDMGNYLPVGVRCGGENVDSTMTISDAINTFGPKRHGEERCLAEFEVELSLQVKLGEDGAPEYQEWQANAFCSSNAGKQHARRQRAKLGLDEHAHDESKQREEDDQFDPRNGMSGKFLPPGIHTLFDGPERIAFEVERDWRNIRKCQDFKIWFSESRTGELDEEKEEDTRSAVLNAFEDLCHIIDYYTWTGHRADPFSLTLDECKHLVHHCGLVDLKETPKAVDDMLRRLRAGIRDADPINAMVMRYEVLGMVLSVASSQFSTTSVVMLSEVQRILDECITSPAKSLQNADKVDSIRAPMWRQAVTRAFRSRRAKEREPARNFEAMFESACIQSQVHGTPAVMSLQEFMLWCDDALPADVVEAWIGSGNQGEEKGSESKIVSGTTPMDRLDRCKDVFSSAQRAFLNRKASPLSGLVLSDFLLAVLQILRYSEDDEEAWKSRVGAHNFLDFIQQCANRVGDAA